MKNSDRPSSKTAARHPLVVEDADSRPPTTSPYPFGDRNTPNSFLEKDRQTETKKKKKDRSSVKKTVHFHCLTVEENGESRPLASTPYPYVERKTPYPSAEISEYGETKKSDRPVAKTTYRLSSLVDDELFRPKSPSPSPGREEIEFLSARSEQRDNIQDVIPSPSPANIQGSPRPEFSIAPHPPEAPRLIPRARIIQVAPHPSDKPIFLRKRTTTVDPKKTPVDAEQHPRSVENAQPPPRRGRPIVINVMPQPSVGPFMPRPPPGSNPRQRSQEAVPKMDLSFMNLDASEEEEEEEPASPDAVARGTTSKILHGLCEGPSDRSRRFGMTYLEKAYGRTGFHLPEIKDSDESVGRNIMKLRPQKPPLVNLDVTENNRSQKLEVKLPTMVNKYREPMRATEPYPDQTQPSTKTYSQPPLIPTLKSAVNQLPALGQQTSLINQKPPKPPPGPRKGLTGPPRPAVIEKLRALTQERPPCSRKALSPRPPRTPPEQAQGTSQHTTFMNRKLSPRTRNAPDEHRRLTRESITNGFEQLPGMKQNAVVTRTWKTPDECKMPPLKQAATWVPVMLGPRQEKGSVVVPLPSITTDEPASESSFARGDLEYIQPVHSLLAAATDDRFIESPEARRDDTIVVGLEEVHISPTGLCYETTPSPPLLGKLIRTSGDNQDRNSDTSIEEIRLVEEANIFTEMRGCGNQDLKTDFEDEADLYDNVTDLWKEKERMKFKELVEKEMLPHKPKPPHHIGNPFVTGPFNVEIVNVGTHTDGQTGATRQPPASLRKRRQPRFKKDN